MIKLKGLVVCAVAGVAALALGAQQKQTSILQVEFQTPKNGMVKQYEEGRKQKIAWHKQMKDPRPLFVWEMMTGEQTGTYIVAGANVHWKDLDNPPISEAADQAEWDKVIGNSVEAFVLQNYEYMEDMSRPTDAMMPSKFAEVLTFSVKIDKTEEWVADFKKIDESIKKTNWPGYYRLYSLAHGGKVGTFVLVVEHPNYADFQEPAKTFEMMLGEALGKDDAKALSKRMDSYEISIEAQFVKFRQDLSYIPAATK